jgi:hypothetical protein
MPNADPARRKLVCSATASACRNAIRSICSAYTLGLERTAVRATPLDIAAADWRSNSGAPLEVALALYRALGVRCASLP